MDLYYAILCAFRINGRGNARDISGARGQYFLLFAINNSLAIYVYYCSVQIVYQQKNVYQQQQQRKQIRVEGRGRMKHFPSVIVPIPLQNFDKSTAMTFVNEKSFEIIILMYFRYLRGSCCVMCRTLCWCGFFVFGCYWFFNIRYTKPWFFSHLFQPRIRYFVFDFWGKNREENKRLP